MATGWPRILGQAQCLSLRQDYREGRTMDELAIQFGVSRATVSAIIGGTAAQVLGLPGISRGRGRPSKPLKVVTD